MISGNQYLCLILKGLTPQDGQIHSNKLSAAAQTNRRQQPSICLSVFDHFLGLVHKGLIKAYLGPCQTSIMNLFTIA